MPDATESTSSAISFTSGTPTALVVDGVLVDGDDIYAETSSSIAFDSADTGEDGFDTNSELEFDQIICVDQDYVLATSSSITFVGGTSNLHDPSPATTLNDPPTGFVFPVIKKRRLSDTIAFTDSITVVGGYILDLSCEPSMFVPNFPSWSELGEWTYFSEAEWELLG